MHGIVNKHPKPMTFIFCRKLMAVQCGDAWATIFSFRIRLLLLWVRFF